MRRPKLELEDHKPTEIELIFDECVSGRNTYGVYHLYGILNNGSEAIFFAPSEVHTELSKLKKGDKALVTKIATMKNNRVVIKYDIQIPSKAKAVHKPIAKVVSIGEAIEEVLPDIPLVKPHDDSFQLMKQSYSDALQLILDLKGQTSDIARIAITLFIQRSKTHQVTLLDSNS